MNIFDIIRVPIGWVLRMCYKLVPNYMVALLFFAVIMQILLLPFAIKQQKNSIKQAKMGPKVAAIRKKYQGRNDQATQQKMQQETMDLYQKENFNPAGGCLPLLIQMPILFALFHVITQPLRYLCGIPQNVVNKICEILGYMSEGKSTGLAMYPQIGAMSELSRLSDSAFADTMKLAEYELQKSELPNLWIGRLDLSAAPKDFGLSWMLLIPIITVAALLFTQWITKKFTYQPPEAKDAQSGCSMKLMMYSMPLLSGYFAYMYAAAIGIYWIFRNLIGLVQQIIVAKVMPLPVFTEEDYKAAERELLGSKSKRKNKKAQDLDPDRPKVRSLHHIDDDDEGLTIENMAQKKAEEAQKSADGKSSDDSSESSALSIEAPLKEDKGKKFKKK